MIVLHRSTGSQAGDEVARSVIAAFEAAFPGRVRGYYLEGSYADGTGIATSDLDLVIVFTAAFLDAAERDRAKALGCQVAARGALAADLTIVDEQQLSAGVDPAIKFGSHCLFGEDIRDRLPLLPIEVWTRQRMHAAYWLIIHVFDRPAVVVHPIDYPAPAGEFYGYDNRAVLLPDGTPARSTRNLIRVTGWAATALIAGQAGIYVARKRECHLAYHQHVADGWGELLTAIYERCRSAWRYLIPDVPDERSALRAICARTLGFENYFLARYRQFVLAELQRDDAAARLDALRFLDAIPYRDEEIRQALVVIERDAGGEAGHAARRVLDRLERAG